MCHLNSIKPKNHIKIINCLDKISSDLLCFLFISSQGWLSSVHNAPWLYFWMLSKIPTTSAVKSKMTPESLNIDSIRTLGITSFVMALRSEISSGEYLAFWRLNSQLRNSFLFGIFSKESKFKFNLNYFIL